MSEVNQKRCLPAGISEAFRKAFLHDADGVICDDEKKRPTIKISDRKWHVSVSGGVGFTAEHIKVEGPGGLVRNERREPTSAQGFGIVNLSVARRLSLSHQSGSYESETVYIASRLDLSYSRLHAESRFDASHDDIEKIDVHANRYMALAGLAFGFDTSSVGGLSLFALMGPEIIPSYTVESEGGDYEESNVHSLTTFRTGFEMLFPLFDDDPFWGLGLEMGGIYALNPVVREKQWGLEVLGGVHFRF